MRAAFVGLGNMGRGMARNLVAAGFPTAVVDVRAPAVEDLVAAGASAPGSCAAAAAQADVVCVAVFDEQQVRAAMTGADGVLATARPGTVVAIHSTVSPEFVVELAGIAGATGVAVIDVAMTGGGDVAAEAGALTFMVGGEPAAVERARPALEAMARSIFHLGPLGAGTSAKIVSNFLATANVALVREALRIAAGAGLDEGVLEVIGVGAVGSSWVSDNWQRIRAQEENYTTGRSGMVAMWEKDIRLAGALAAAHGVEAPLAMFIVDAVLPDVAAAGLTGTPVG